MYCIQKEIVLTPRERGFHLVTGEIIQNLPELSEFSLGIAHIFICHTSASLTISENADPDVREDFETHFNKYVPENAPYYVHTLEGADDMPAHIKASILGSSVTVPVRNGTFNVGTWQGIYLCEHRNHGGSRKLIVTIMGTRK
jgi:secondary thiamine-phosphate synthase enzyme